ncbi:MAG TPA: MFS transporter [Haliangiales bacterium]|nr:MFS transporter [Haliangiales bacterium]
MNSAPTLTLAVPVTTSSLPRSARLLVLAAAFGALLFDGVELGLMPVGSLSVAKNLLGEQFTVKLGGDWFAWLTASLMLGAAVGGIALGALGDRIGRRRALGVSVLFYSVFAGLGAFVTSLEQMLVLRFLVGLGVGGVWPNGVALVSECWPNVSRPVVAGIVGAGINVGILLLSQVARIWHVTPDSWRWLFGWSALPAVLGVFVLWTVSESPHWLAMRGAKRAPATPLAELLRPPLRRTLMIGIMLGAIPMIGAWAASKWMIPWADQIGGTAQPGYKASTQGYWALGAVLGSFLGAQLASRVGRRLSYFLISVGSAALTCGIFLFTAPLRPEFLPLVFAQGFVATLFFGWLPLYLPELFPTRVRATGTGIAYNVGRFATALGVCVAGTLVGWFNGDLAKVGAATALIYALGMVVIWWAPDTRGRTMDE